MATDKPFDMPDASHTWEERGGWLVNRLAAEFSLQPSQAAGIVGNLGFESAGFTKLHEVGQPEGKGGYGWAQWTGPRRVDFLEYAGMKGLDWRSDEANYGYLMAELQSTHHNTIRAVSATSTIDDAVFSVGQTYERPGGTTAKFLPGFDHRSAYARLALAGAWVSPEPAPSSSRVNIRELIFAMQQALNDQTGAGLSVDGMFGPMTYAAVRDWQRRSA